MKKICVILILFFMISSNSFLSLTNLYAFTANNNENTGYAANLQSQCCIIVKIPKDFVNMCVKVGQEIHSFNIVPSEFSALFPKSKNNFSDSEFALTLNNNLKTKIDKNICGNISFCAADISERSNAYYLFIIILLLYLIGYIGLLRVFDSCSLFERFFCAFLKLCPETLGQSFILEIK